VLETDVLSEALAIAGVTLESARTNAARARVVVNIILLTQERLSR
jgi:hypothetical protein